MKHKIKLYPSQKALVENHLFLVRLVIMQSIHVNETIYGFSYDDLFQEGCIWLCMAAVSYNENLAQFPTYAKKVIRNGLISYCRQMCNKQRRISHLEIGERGELTADGVVLEQEDHFRAYISLLETTSLLESMKNDYHGISRLGIEALELKIRGKRITDIAALYNVPASYVGAWISRSAEKLRNDPKFLSSI